MTTWASGSTFKSCKFNTQGKAAIFVKDGVDSDCGDVDVIITRCSANYARPYNQLDPGDPSLSQSVLWNVEKGSRSAECDVNVTLDGNIVYSGDSVV